MREEASNPGEIFGFFTEIGIINQLSTALLARGLPEGMHPSHFSILNHLARVGDGKPPVQIAAAMQVTKNTMTHSLGVLQGRGYITVSPDPDDGRGKLVYLTEAGRSFRERAIAELIAAVGPVIGPDQRDIMRRIRDDLAALRAHLDQNR